MKRNKRGFTVAELAVVIAVIAILAAILIPHSSGITKNASKAAVLSKAKNSYVQFLKDHAEDENFRVPSYIKVEDMYFPIVDGDVTFAVEISPTDVKETGCAEHENCVGIQFDIAIADEIITERERAAAEKIYASYAKNHVVHGGFYIKVGENVYAIDFISGAATRMDKSETADMHLTAACTSTDPAHEDCKYVFRNVEQEAS